MSRTVPYYGKPAIPISAMGIGALASYFGAGRKSYPTYSGAFPRANYGRSRFRRGRISKGYTRRVGNYGRFGIQRDTGEQREHKFHDVSDLGTAFATAGTVSDALLTIAEGSGESNRVGRKIWLKSINIRILLSKSQDADQDQIIARVLIVQDTQCNGALPAVTDVLETADELSYLKLNNTGRFRILKDKLVVLQSQAGFSVASPAGEYSSKVALVKFRKKCNIPVMYNGTAGTIDQIPSNNIFAIGIASAAVGNWSVACRFRFTD